MCIPCDLEITFPAYTQQKCIFMWTKRYVHSFTIYYGLKLKNTQCSSTIDQIDVGFFFSVYFLIFFLSFFCFYFLFSLFLVVFESLRLHELQHTRLSLSFTVSQSLLRLMSIDAIQPFQPLSLPSPVLSLSQHQGLFQ